MQRIGLADIRGDAAVNFLLWLRQVISPENDRRALSDGDGVYAARLVIEAVLFH
jgi:hypothetical protein